MENGEKSRLDRVFSIPAVAVALSVVCNVLWGSALPFIKMGYRLWQIDSSDTATIMCFAGVRFILAGLLVFVCGCILQRRIIPMPRSPKLLLQCVGLGLWQTTLEYYFYYTACAFLTGAMGGILNSVQSFLGVILAHFLYGKADRMTKRKALGCIIGFSGVLFATASNTNGGTPWGMACMLIAGVVFTFAGPWNKSLCKEVDGFTVCFFNLTVGGIVLFCIGFALGGNLQPNDPAGIPVLLYLAFLSSSAYLLWALLMKNNPVSRISISGLLLPVMNVGLSALLNGEPLFEWNFMIAMVMVIAGMWLVNTVGRRRENG